MYSNYYVMLTDVVIINKLLIKSEKVWGSVTTKLFF